MNDTFKNADYQQMVLFQRMEEVRELMENYDEKLASLRQVLVDVASQNVKFSDRYTQHLAQVAKYAGENMYKKYFDEVQEGYSEAMKQGADSTDVKIYDKIRMLGSMLDSGMNQASHFIKNYEADLKALNDKKPETIKRAMEKGGLKRRFDLVEIVEIVDTSDKKFNNASAKPENGPSR